MRFRGACGVAAWAAAILVLSTVGASAQTQTEQQLREAEQQRLLLEQQERARRASQTLPSVEAVTYQDVLADPDNVDLNFRYAQAQVARGDVRGAAATLERILLVRQDLPAIRLFYAIVLYRLDNVVEAEREFREVLKLDITPAVRAEVDKYLGEIALRQKAVVFTARVSLGLRAESNVNSAPRGDQALFFGLPVTLGGRAQAQEDFAFLGIASIDAVHDLNMPEGHELTFGATYYMGEQFEIDSQDVHAGTARVGMNLQFEHFDFKPRFAYTNLYLSREKYFTGVALGGRIEKDNVLPAWGTAGYIDAFWSRESFHNIFEDPAGRLRSGPRVEVAAGLTQVLNRRNQLNGEVAFISKRARANHHEYEGARAAAGHTLLLGGGSFLLTGLSLERRLYRGSNVFVTPNQVRADWDVRLRSTFGLPLGALLSEERFGREGAAYYAFLRDVTWTVTGELVRQSSNIPNFDFANFRGQTLLTKTWRF